MKIRLTKQELSLARQAAALRWQLARAAAVSNQKRAGESDGDLDYLGIRAEMAVAKLLGADYSAMALGIDDGVDMWVGDVSIDVKATFHETGRLLFKSHDSFNADLAILVTRTEAEDVMNVVGGVGRAVFLREAAQADLGRGLCYVMDQIELMPMPDIWAKLCERKYQ